MLAVNKVSLLYTEKGLGHSAILMFYPFCKDLEVGSWKQIHVHKSGLKYIYIYIYKRVGDNYSWLEGLVHSVLEHIFC